MNQVFPTIWFCESYCEIIRLDIVERKNVCVWHIFFVFVFKELTNRYIVSNAYAYVNVY